MEAAAHDGNAAAGLWALQEALFTLNGTFLTLALTGPVPGWPAQRTHPTGRVMIFENGGSGTHWERHPAGEE